ncbi:hypothetical protein [Microbacterium sp.]|uniref:acyl-CoA-like ligand-binding transcription factor n=1 Tax=Microbacterium sp. TaxID=51671 RepID=UPI003C766C8A
MKTTAGRCRVIPAAMSSMPSTMTTRLPRSAAVLRSRSPSPSRPTSPSAIGDAVLEARPAASPLAVTLEALAQVGTTLVEHIDRTAERRAVIASSPELQERERTKLAAVTSAIQDALLQRGVDDDSAKLVAQIATIASQNAFNRWTDGGGREDFAACLHTVAASLRDTLTADNDSSRSE